MVYNKVAGTYRAASLSQREPCIRNPHLLPMDRIPPVTPAGRKIPAKAFTLYELLTVITIIMVLVAIAVPSITRSMFGIRAAKCFNLHGHIVKACVNYALEHKRMYPVRFAGADTNDNPWYWTTGGVTPAHTMCATAEKYFEAPKGLTCTIGDMGFKWPKKVKGVYVYDDEPARTTIGVYAGWDITHSSNVEAIFFEDEWWEQPDLPSGDWADFKKAAKQVPYRLGDHRPDQPLSGDFLTDRASAANEEDRDWWTPHSSNRVHYEPGPEKPPLTDPIPFGYEDNSVRPTLNFAKLYRTAGEGTRYWGTR